MKRADATATYIYCVVHGRQAPAGARRPRGLPGTGPVRVLDAGDGLWLVVGAAPLRRYGRDPIGRGLHDLKWVSACAMAHEGVVEHFTGAGTVIPMKLFTLFSTDQRALAHVRRSRKRLARLIARVANRQEWGVRLSVDEARARGRLTAGAASRDGRPGTGFLLGKKRERDSARRLVEGARAAAERVFTALVRRADDARRQTPPQSEGGISVVLDATFLVPARRLAGFRGSVERLARRLGNEGYVLTLTGPWPPYTFVAEPA